MDTVINVEAAPRKRVVKPEFIGPVGVDDALKQHIESVVIPLANSICNELGVSPHKHTISIANVGAASGMDEGVELSGYSADVALLTAVLSACLGIPIRPGIVSTGHIASLGGEIRYVRNIPAKLAAALQHGDIETFVYPPMDADLSVDGLMSQERDAVLHALGEARPCIRLVPLSDVTGIPALFFEDTSILTGALSQGFFGAPLRSATTNTSVSSRFVECLLPSSDEYFWQTVRSDLRSRDFQGAQDLVSCRLRFHIARHEYPICFGHRLRDTMSSLPRVMRRQFARSLRIALGDLIQLSQLAVGGNEDDAILAFEAFHSPLAKSNAGESSPVTPDASAVDESASSHAVVNLVLDELSAESLANVVTLPIDAARGAFVLESALVRDHDEFLDTVTAFYAHLLVHTGTMLSPCGGEAIQREAAALLRRTFPKEDLRDAEAEARNGIHGGMRMVLDAMTDRLKSEQTESHIAKVLRENVDPLDWTERVAFTSAFIDRAASSIPREVREEAPERYARRLEDIIRTYVNSTEEVNQLLKRL